jgi:hypothetical protein
MSHVIQRIHRPHLHKVKRLVNDNHRHGEQINLVSKYSIDPFECLSFSPIFLGV